VLLLSCDFSLSSHIIIVDHNSHKLHFLCEHESNCPCDLALLDARHDTSRNVSRLFAYVRLHNLIS